MKKEGFSHESQAIKSVDWYTPAWVFQSLGLTFDLDPCQPVGGISWIPATQHYTEKENGLSSPWFGRVWLNPPYGRDTPAWLERMDKHRHGVALLFARTDCEWFHRIVTNADAMLFLRGRVRFVDGKQKTGGGGPGSGSMLIAWGGDCVDALSRMTGKGMFVRLRRFGEVA